MPASFFSDQNSTFFGKRQSLQGTCNDTTGTENTHTAEETLLGLGEPITCSKLFIDRITDLSSLGSILYFPCRNLHMQMAGTLVHC